MSAPQPLPSAYPDRTTAALVGLVVLGVAISAITAYSTHARPVLEAHMMAPLLILSGIFAYLATQVAARIPTQRALWIIFGFAVLFRLLALSQEPILSTDIYRYIWDGRVQAAGINPYRYIPADQALASLRDAAIYPNINRADFAPTIYPPAAQFFFFAVTRLSETTLAMRLALVGCEVAVVLVVLDLMRLTGRPPVLIAAYAWHPMPIWEIANSGHVDALALALLMGALWLFLRVRRTLAGVALALAVLVKPYLIVASPALWRRWDWRLPLAAIATVLLCYLPYLGVGTKVFGYFGGYLGEEGLESGSAFWLVDVAHALFGSERWQLYVYLEVAVVVLAAIAFRASFRSDALPASVIGSTAILLMAGLFFLSPNYPWYMLAVVPFLSLGAGLPGWVLTVGAFVDYMFWPDKPLLWKSVHYGAFFLAIAIGALMRRRAADPVVA